MSTKKYLRLSSAGILIPESIYYFGFLFKRLGPSEPRTHPQTTAKRLAVEPFSFRVRGKRSPFGLQWATHPARVLMAWQRNTRYKLDTPVYHFELEHRSPI